MGINEHHDALTTRQYVLGSIGVAHTSLSSTLYVQSNARKVDAHFYQNSRSEYVQLVNEDLLVHMCDRSKNNGRTHLKLR